MLDDDWVGALSLFEHVNKSIAKVAKTIRFIFSIYSFLNFKQHFPTCQTKRATEAMDAGVTDKLWDLSDIVELIDN